MGENDLYPWSAQDENVTNRFPRKFHLKKSIFDLNYSAAFQVTSYNVEKVPISRENGAKTTLS